MKLHTHTHIHTRIYIYIYIYNGKVYNLKVWNRCLDNYISCVMFRFRKWNNFTTNFTFSRSIFHDFVTYNINTIIIYLYICIYIYIYIYIYMCVCVCVCVCVHMYIWGWIKASSDWRFKNLKLILRVFYFLWGILLFIIETFLFTSLVSLIFYVWINISIAHTHTHTHTYI